MVRQLPGLLMWVAVLFPASVVFAQTAETGSADAADELSEPAAGSEMVSLLDGMPPLQFGMDESEWLTGDWGGVRRDMVDNGIIFGLDLTQIIQGNAHGGKDTNNAFRYTGSADYVLTLDTARMGLWPGGLLVMKGETQFGQSINPKVGALMQPNTDALFPVPGETCETTLSELFFMQALSEKVVLTAGKVDPTRLADVNAFANSEKTQFLNLGLRNNPVVLPFAPYTMMAAAVTVIPVEWLSFTTAIGDTHGSARRTGFDTAFHSPDGMTVAQEWDFRIRPFGLTGYQRVGWAWTSKDSRALGQDPRIGLPVVQGTRLLLQSVGILPTDTRPDDWAVWYNFDQWVYNEPDDSSQGIGVFGRIGWSTGDANLTEGFYSIGLSGTGLICSRDSDVLGLGYYYMDVSDGLRSYGVVAEQGVEMFYNVEVTPWLHVTPDLQFIVDPAGGFQDRDVAVVYGIRAHMTF